MGAPYVNDFDVIEYPDGVRIVQGLLDDEVVVELAVTVAGGWAALLEAVVWYSYPIDEGGDSWP